MDNDIVRVRFAPSPTGIMHLGNVRTALFNYLFAFQKNGVFILRIEDTDPERMFDPQAKHIIADLAWMGLPYTEGPLIGGPHEPYFQSQRSHIYQEKLDILRQKNLVYRCFCSAEELAKRRDRQRALKQAPRYEKTCFKLSQQQIEDNLQKEIPFIWRFNIANYTKVTIHDLARGNIEFDLSHFSDFPLTRQDGSFTFMFANAVDDIVMQISHVLRGEDHLSNTANQAALFQAFTAPLPIFWHMPILCNSEGKKLSKRDFGFSLHDLKKNGFLPEAINNYLGIIGGSFAQEIMTLNQLATTFNFQTIHATSGIKYDVEKLRWVNHKWIEQYSDEQLIAHAVPFLYAAYPQSQKMDKATITKLLHVIKSELIILTDIEKAAQFYFVRPTVSRNELLQFITLEQGKQLAMLIVQHRSLLPNCEAFLNALKKDAKAQNIDNKKLFAILRLILTQTTAGPRIQDIMELLNIDELQQRLETAIKLLA